MARGPLVRDALRGSILGAGAGLVLAKYGGSKNFGTPIAIGALLGALGASYLRARSGGETMFTGFAPPPHPIEVMPNFDPHGAPRDQARAVIQDYYHDNDLRSWVDDGAVKRALHRPTRCNANVWMLGAGLGQLAVHQGTATPAHKAALSTQHARAGYWPFAEQPTYYWQ